MLALAVDLDEIAAAAGERVFQDCFRIEARPALVERRQQKIGAVADRPLIRRQGPRQKTEERRLAGTIGADQAETVAAQNAGREVLDDRPLAKEFSGILGFYDELAGKIRLGGLELD